MNKLAALLVATALAGPVLYAVIPPEMKDESRKIEVKKPVVSKNRKVKKSHALPSVSVLHNPDFPWQTPA